MILAAYFPLFAVALISTVPAVFAVTKPLVLTVAIVSFSDDHKTV